MRTRSILLITLSFVGALALSGPAWNAVQPPEKVPAPEPKPAEEIVPVKTAIMPHRAIYDLSLASAKNGSNIIDVSGQMLFEWRDVCDGWAVQQHLRLHFSYAEGDTSNVTSTQLSWESKDGKRYNFNIRRVSDGKETDRYVGKAVMKENGGVATYTAPEAKELKLPPGTLFPTAHTESILQKATTGEKLFTRRVFDGSDEEGSNDISAFISNQEAHWQKTELDQKLVSKPILSYPDWPVRLAFFKITSETGEPDYEMNLSLLANGVARKMNIDYGDFSVNGTLVEIEPMPTSGCP
ncbi:MAG: cell envelope integrity EipB family protein [Alphaproteobacteria bacterium]|nr:cell envelope integrity EipB family protein [Alphaproteobacteria bacterium]